MQLNNKCILIKFRFKKKIVFKYLFLEYFFLSLIKINKSPYRWIHLN